MGKKWFILLLVVVFFVSCGSARKQAIKDKEPEKIPSSSFQVTQQTEPLVVPPSIFHSDPTLGKIKNDTRNIWIKIWVDPEVRDGNMRQYDQLNVILGEPTLTLIPGLARELCMDLGVHLVYAEGLIKTKYGWKSLGFATKDVLVDSSISGGGHYGWYVSFSQGDFQR